MKEKSHLDAIMALFLIFVLMVSLLAMNTFDILYNAGEVKGIFPVSNYFVPLFRHLQPEQSHIYFEINWWIHIVLIFIFANYLPYSKHFHVFMSVPNVFLSRLEPLGKLRNMECVENEVKMMLDPENIKEPGGESPELIRFGVLDATDVTWKNYLDSLTCTECGRCSAVCPANITGKKLSPRKIMMDLRARMKEKGNGILKKGTDFDDSKTLIGNYVSEEELWACTTCNACAKECPVNIDHPSLIVDMRRYLVMEKSSAPSGINSIFANIENNGSPWQISWEDRMRWAENL
jgi:heterodisulfide reductase subunit C